jgi:membrane-associated protein
MLGFSVAEHIVRWLEPAFAVAGYAIVAVAVLCERSIFVGLIIPGDLILALGGVYASQGKLNVVLVILIGTAAAITGETIGYWLGRRVGRGLLAHLPLANRLGKYLDEAEAFFRRNGGKTVAIGRYATVAGAFVPFTAGVAKMPYRRFLLFDVPAIAVWATGISVFGYLAGEHIGLIDTALSRFGYVVLGAIAVFFLARFLWKRVRSRRVEGGPGPPG